MFQQVVGPQHAIGHAQRMLDGRSSSRHGHVGEVGEALEIGAVGQQHLASPDGPIHAIARAVEGDAADCVGQPVLGHDRHNVGMVMLHFGHRKSLVMGPFARQVLGVQVACHRRRLHFEEALEAILRGQPRVVGLGVFHVSDVLGYEAVGAAQQREGVLLFRAGGENDALGRRSALGRHRHGHRRIAPRPAQELDGVPGLPVDLIHLDQPHDRIVEARKDGAIVP